jgi:hypothetical protein
MLVVTLIAGSRVRARRRRTARAAASGWAPAVATAGVTSATAAPTGRWGEGARHGAADFDEWHEEEPARPEATAATVPPPAVAAPAGPAAGGGAPFTLQPEPEPSLDQLDEHDLDDVFAGRQPAPADSPREPAGRFTQEPALLVPDARSVFGDVDRPRGGAAGFRSAPRRGGLGGALRSPAVRAAAYAALGIALVAIIVNVALGGGGEDPAPAARPAPTTAAPPPAQTPAGPTAEEIAAATGAAGAEHTDALDAARRAERAAVAAERRAIRRRRAAAARRRREAAAQPGPAAPQQQPAQPAPVPPSGGGGGGTGGGSGGGSGGSGGGSDPCELGCIG